MKCEDKPHFRIPASAALSFSYASKSAFFPHNEFILKTPFMRAVAFFFLMITCCSCKKDLLHFQSAKRIETHTTTDRLDCIYFISDSIGFITGGERFLTATILSTRDGGNSWNYQNFPEAGKRLSAITQAPSGVLYTIGFDGKMLISKDTGRTWSFFQSWFHPYKDIYFPAANRGLIVGGISFNAGFKTVIDGDGFMQPYDSLSFELNDIEMANPKTGFIAGYGVILKTTDSAKTFQELNIHNENFTALFAKNESEIWTCGYNGSVYHSADGGNKWEAFRNGNNITIPRYRLLDIAFRDSENGFACGEDGLLIYTDDGGRHWFQFEHFTDAALRNIWLMADGSLLVCGDAGTLYRLFPK